MGSRLYKRPTDAIRNLKELLTSENYDWNVYYSGYEPRGVYTPFITLEQIGGGGRVADATMVNNFDSVIIINIYCTISDGKPILDYVDQIYSILAKMHTSNYNPPSAVNYQQGEASEGVELWQITTVFTG